jgi:hypothetical protein
LVERLRTPQWAWAIHRVCLRGLRPMRLHDSIPSIGCDGNQVKPVIDTPKDVLVLWFQKAIRGSGESKSERGSSIVVAAPGLFLLRGG